MGERNLKVEASDSFMGGEMQVTSIYFANSNHIDEELPDFAMNITTEHSNLLSVEDVQMAPGEEVAFSVALDNETQFSAFQMDIYMPDGLKIIPNSFILTTRAQHSHTCSSLSFEGGRTRVVCFSTSNEAFSGDSGELFTFRFTTDEKVSEKSEIQFKNILFSTAKGLEKELPSVSSIVTVEVVPVEEIVVDPTSYSGEIGEEVQMTATVYPENATNKNVEWSSSDEEVVTVDANGLVTLVGAGEAIVRATATDGSEVYAQADFTANVDTSVNEVASMGEEHIEIYDLNGVVVYSAKAVGLYEEMDMLNIPSGIYVLKTTSETRVVFIK